MRRKIRTGLETLAIMGALALAFCIAAPRTVHAQNLQRFAANHLEFSGEVTATTANTTAVDPVNFYDNKVQTTAATDIMYVTLAATGDTHGDNASLFRCTIDGTTCKTGNTGSAPAGWIALQRNKSDEHDNSIYYTWCVPVEKTKKNLHEVKLFLANSAGTAGEDVFIEGVNVFVDGEHFGKGHADQACTSTGLGESSS